MFPEYNVSRIWILIIQSHICQKSRKSLPLSIFPDPEHEQDLLNTETTAPYSEFSNTASCVQAILVKRLTKTTKTIEE